MTASKRHRWQPQETDRMASDVQGVLQLLETAEIRDVLATAGVQFEQLRRMGPFGGVVLQLQGIMQKGFKVRPYRLYYTQYSSMHYIQCSSLPEKMQHRKLLTQLGSVGFHEYMWARFLPQT